MIDQPVPHGARLDQPVHQPTDSEIRPTGTTEDDA